MKAIVRQAVQKFLARKSLYRFNRFLYELSLNSIGVLNYQNYRVSGEEWLMGFCAKNGVRTIVDIGANEGTYARLCRRLLPDAKIMALEPHPITFQKLRQAAESLNLEPFNLGCGAAAGNLKIYDYQNRDGSSHASLHREVIEEIHGSASTSHDVDVVRLDEFLAEREVDQLDLVKIDTEGHELEVLAGFGVWLSEKRVRIIHFEFNEMNVVSRSFFRDFQQLLTGYDMYRLLPDGLVPLTNEPVVATEIFAFQNLVALRSDCLAS